MRTIAALLHHQLAFSGCIPKRAVRRRDGGQRFQVIVHGSALAQDVDVGGVQLSTAACHKANLRVFHLSWTALAAHLPYAFHDVQPTFHVRLGQVASCGVDGQLPPQANATAFNERARLSNLAEAAVLKPQQDAAGEVVVELGDIDVAPGTTIMLTIGAMNRDPARMAWADFSHVADFFPDAPRTGEALNRVLFDIGRLLRIRQEKLMRGLQKAGAGRLLLILDYLLGKGEAIRQPEAYFETILRT